MDTALPQKFPFILDRNLSKANCTENRVCTSCDTVVLVRSIVYHILNTYIDKLFVCIKLTEIPFVFNSMADASGRALNSISPSNFPFSPRAPVTTMQGDTDGDPLPPTTTDIPHMRVGETQVTCSCLGY